MHALVLFTSALKEKIAQPAIRKIVDNIDASVEALQSLFNAVLNISKLDAGIVEVDRRAFALKEILAPMAKEFQAEAQEKQLQFAIAAGDHAVYSDPQLLSRIMRNLIANAIRYTDNGAVSVRCERVQEQVLITVSDTGSGIPRHHQRDIFNEFVQLHNAERDHRKGLGLAIVKRLADLLGCQVLLASAPGQGTRFSVSVPRAKHLPVANPGAALPCDPGLSLNGFKVLVVDDEASIRQGLSTLLDAWGCEVEAFASRTEALAFLHTHDFAPDVILADYRLQNHETGVQAIEAIVHLRERAIPAAIITGDTAPDRLAEASGGGYLLLHKPVKPMQIRSYLRRIQTGLIPPPARQAGER